MVLKSSGKMVAKAILEIAWRLAGFTRTYSENTVLSVIGTGSKVATDVSNEFLRMSTSGQILS
jgi:hypothetical protein